MMISTNQADQVLLKFAGVADEHAQRFLERLKLLRRLGVPAGVPRGRGVASGRTVEQMLETALAIRLLEGGLASSDVARLVDQEWGMASDVFELFDPDRVEIGWPDGPPTDLLWVAAPAGLAAYRACGGGSGAQPTLTTILLFEEGFKLEAALDDVGHGASWTLIVIRAKGVVLDLHAAYAAAGLDPPDQLVKLLRGLLRPLSGDDDDLPH
jgi:hypothetical protein